MQALDPLQAALSLDLPNMLYHPGKDMTMSGGLHRGSDKHAAKKTLTYEE